MRQRISVAQLQELSPEQQEKLRELWEPKLGDIFFIPKNGEEIHVVDRTWLLIIKNDPRFMPLFDIGQCIELLGCKLEKIEYGKNYYVYANINTGNNYELIYKEELIDALFEAVKAVL